jgi:glycosyltransferase involved in cell wall biosynthesis
MSLNDNKTDETIRSKALGLESDKKYRFHIVTPFYNCSSLLSRCLACVNGQTIDKSKICMTVIDDASDMDESYRAKTMCSKYGFVSYVRSPERVNTGGAKNIGINKNVNCDYIVFLDADDTFMDERCLERLDKELEESGGPDVMLCGFVFGDSGKSRMFSATTPKAMSEANCIAPWMRVATPAKTGLFNEKRRVASDVTHYLRQLDSVSTVASLSFPLIRYAKDNPNSAWASKKVDLSKDVIRAKFLLMSDMLTERFVHEYTRKAAVRQMKYEYNVSLKEAMDSIKEGTFE